ncbi:MAG: KOW domain-containing RNA-binding protein [Roseburia sp.]|nr:KOW domain-containing RNA-binding protein [Roseburia sp.]
MKIKTPEEGMLAQSVQGRDCGRFYVILEVSGGNFVTVADGTARPLENPKKKNVKHLRLLPRNIFREGVARDKSFNVRTAHILKELAEKVKSED